MIHEDLGAKGRDAGLGERGEHGRSRVGELSDRPDPGRRELGGMDEVMEQRGDQVERGQPLRRDQFERVG